MIQKTLSILLGFAGFIILDSGHAASFDCNKARQLNPHLFPANGPGFV